MSGPRCIVCGRPIAKLTKTIWFKAPWGDHPEGSRDDRNSFLVTIYMTNRPRDRNEAKRFTNHAIISSKRDRDGSIAQIGTWDGESYRDPHFCTLYCAQRQGYAAAQHGHRYTWKDKP
jgi:hypothetical protein